MSYYECNLPRYLQKDLDAFKEGRRVGSSLMDCLWGELYGSINGAEIDVPRIDFAKINAFIGAVPYLTDLQRNFYRTYLAARFAALFAADGR